ncbi:signal peptide peptidase SppA [Candidatus Falkowbacteria bacterium CG10_big_fil_rev_8_21_14_0_10_44_15]|uniref:Signal peptide peptidase SppA n=1 Tax=Candidatus Falkowbacteria bacterium CG10_big_fil_rev_8_21_14_0_10_44_15 TaxID=1974569 RepID=A0A2H0V0H3_9BACT|nr:MAG: signal peptide peptidase SppA [Candidatus Falkowbacteria bacterium CG10_big_fil_rev_8_21_14_0_10_44_15]
MKIKKSKKILISPIFKFKINSSKLNPKNYNWGKIKGFLKIFILAMAAVFIVLLTIDLITSDFVSDEEENEEISANISDMVIAHLDDNYFMPEDKKDDCNVLGIELHGEITTYIPYSSIDGEGNLLEDQTASEDIVYAIRGAEKDENIKALILEVDSYGGYPVAGEEVAIALKNANKPNLALIREGGASAAYLAASGADKIFASKNSDVGSIAVTMSYLDYVQQNQKDGLTYIPLSSGKFKDIGDPNKLLTPEEKELLMRDVNILHQNFVKMVAENRNLDIEKVKKLADGSTILGEMALENGLIDQIGGISEVEEYLQGIIGEDVEVCW